MTTNSSENTTTREGYTLTPMTNLIRLLNPRKGREKGSVSRCNVCGLEDARNDQKLNDPRTAHGYAHTEKLTKRAEHLEKLLNASGTSLLDLAQREQFNAEAALIASKIMAARKEHEKWQAEAPARAEAAARAGGKPVTVAKAAPVHVNEHAVTVLAREILALMGAKADAERDPVKLLGYVKGNIMLLQNELKEARMKR